MSTEKEKKKTPPRRGPKCIKKCYFLATAALTRALMTALSTLPLTTKAGHPTGATPLRS